MTIASGSSYRAFNYSYTGAATSGTITISATVNGVPLSDTHNFSVSDNRGAPGALDTTFNSTGKLTFNFPATNLWERTVFSNVQPDGKIVLLSGVHNGLATSRFAISRLNSDGTFDTAFNSTGKQEAFLGQANAETGYVQPNGKVLGAGDSGASILVARVNSNGSLDTSFDGDGTASINTGGSSTLVRAMTMQQTGKILIAGNITEGSPAATYAMVTRLNTDGSLDTSFGSSGYAKFATADTTAYGITVDDQDRILVVGSIGTGTSTDFLVYRLSSSGSLDTSFASSGSFRHSLSSATYDRAQSVVVKPNGGILVGGIADELANWGSIGIVLLTSAGSLDTSFNSTGSYLGSENASTQYSDYPLTLLLEPRGQIVVVTGIEDPSPSKISDFFFQRFNADGSLDTNFNSPTGSTTVTFPTGDFDAVLHGALAPDGRIIGVGHSEVSSQWDQAVSRVWSDDPLPTPTSTPTNTPTSTPTYTPTNTPTNTPTHTPTGTPTNTPTNTPTPTPTNTPTSTPTAGPTNSASTFEIQGPSTVYNDVCATYWIRLKDPSGNTITTTEDLTFSFSDNLASSDFFKPSDDCTNAASTMTVTAGSSYRPFNYNYYGASNTSGTLTVSATIRGSLVTVNKSISTSTSNGAPGDLDTTFDSDGKKLDNFTGNTNDWSWNEAVQVQPNDGKIVSIGQVIVSSNRFAITRLNQDGTFDTSFNSSGKLALFTSDGAPGRALRLQPDGKIVAAGSKYTNAIYVARVNTDGTLDTSFGTGGLKTLTPGYNAWIEQALIQQDGKILLTGLLQQGSPAKDHATIVRLNADGSLDTTFDSDGYAILSDADTAAYAIGLTSDNKIIAGGWTGTGANQDLLIYRLTSSGALDTTFGTSGKTVVSQSATTQDRIESLVVLPDDSIMAAGLSTVVSPSNDYQRIGLAKFTSSGALDTSFNTTGKYLGSDKFGEQYGGWWMAVVREPTSDIVAISVRKHNNPGDYPSKVGSMYAERRTAGGLLETGFNTPNGKIDIFVGTGDFDGGRHGVVTPDGRIVIIGHGNLSTEGNRWRFSWARLWGGF